MDLIKLTEYLVKSVSSEPDMVSLKKFETEEDFILIQVMVSKDDMGAVIGKNGKMISSIRTIVSAASYKNNLPKVRINVDSF